jgi:tellurite resistance protein
MSYAVIEPLRFEYESYLYHDLQRHQEIQARRGNRQQYFNLHKRHLLGTAVRITDYLFPDLHRIYRDCLRQIGEDLSGSLYVYQASEYNAHVYAYDQHFDIMLTSAIVKDFLPAEIAFVIGHELGHVIFGHNQIPASEILYDNSQRISAELAKLLFQWSRSAEISADRVGFITCGDLGSAANAFFKLASGIQLNDHNRVVHALRQQYEEIAKLTEELRDSNFRYASTHPLIPIRFKSLELISLDLLALRTTHKQIKPRDLAAINRQVQEVLVRTEPLQIQVQDEYRPQQQSLSLLVLCLLYTALSDGQLTANEEAFAREVVRRAGNTLNLDAVLQDCQNDPAAFRQQAYKEIQECRGSASSDDLLQILHTCAVMCGTGLYQSEVAALHEICAALGGQPGMVEAVLSTR